MKAATSYANVRASLTRQAKVFSPRYDFSRADPGRGGGDQGTVAGLLEANEGEDLVLRQQRVGVQSDE